MTKRVLRLLRRTITSYDLLNPGDAVLVGISGGADSLCLLSLLVEYNRSLKQDWRIFAVHIDPGFAEWKTASVERRLKRLGADYEIARINPRDLAKAGPGSICYQCARARRKRLFDLCRDKGISRLALAHHLEDVNETYLLNLFFTASARAIVPRQELFQGRLSIIRPLYAFTEGMIQAHLRSIGLFAVRNRCPGQKGSQRNTVRRFLERLYRKDSRIRNNIFVGIGNIKADYLPGANGEQRT